MYRLVRSVGLGFMASGIAVVLIVSTGWSAGAETLTPTIVTAVDAPLDSTPMAPAPVDPGKVVPGASLKAGGGLQPSVDPTLPLSAARTFATPDARKFNPFLTGAVSRTTFTTTYTGADGTSQMQVSPTPLNMQRDSGDWVPIGTTLKADAKNGGFSVADNPLNPHFAKSSGGTSDFTVSHGQSTVSFALQGVAGTTAEAPTTSVLKAVSAAGSALATQSDSLTYKAIRKGQDLNYAVEAQGVRTNVVLNAPPSDAAPSWTWTVHAPGLVLAKSDTNRITFTDAAGVVMFVMPTPAMWDSSGVAGKSESAINPVATTLAAGIGDDWTVTLSPDAGWLNDPARVYPVVVDPDVNQSPSGLDEYSRNGSTNHTYSFGVLRVGNSQNAGNTYWRTGVCFPYGNLSGTQLTGAQGLVANAIGGANTTYGGGWFSTGTLSFDGSGLTFLSNFPTTVPSSGNSGYGSASDSGLFGYLNGQLQVGSTTTCWLLTGSEPAGVYTYRQGDVSLYLSNQPLPTITASQVSTNHGTTTSPTGGTVGPLTPTFAVSSTDPSGTA